MEKRYVYIGAVIIVAIVLIFTVFNRDSEEIVNERSEETEKTNVPGCASISLEIIDVNPIRKLLTVKRGLGEGDLGMIQVKINDDVSKVNAQNVLEGKEQVFVMGIDSGDVVEISAVLKDRTVCPVADTASA